MNVGEKLQQLRKNRNLTQPELAHAIGIEQSYLSKLENGKYVPSGEIFDRILEVFGLNVGEFVDDLDHGSRLQLRQIPIVANYYERQKQRIIGDRRQWLFACSALFAIGTGLLYTGTVQLFVPSTVYQYRSSGVVLDGEPKEVFRDARNIGPFAAEARNFLKNRTNEDFLSTRSYRGSVFNIPVEGGSRTYYLDHEARVDSWINKAIAALGLAFAALGLTGLVLEKKLSRYQ